MILVILVLASCGNTYEIVQSQDDVVGDLDRIVAESPFVDEDQVRIIALDLSEASEYESEALLVVTNEERTERVQAVVNFEDGTYEMR